MNEVTALLRAEIDLQEAYERHSTPRLARAYEITIRDAFDQLARHPLSGGEFLGGYRRLVLPRLGYALFYVLEGRRVVIHALLDLRQSPETIRQRLGLPPI